MAKKDSRKSKVSKNRTPKRKKTSVAPKFYVFLLLIALFAVGFHYREALSYYFNFKSESSKEEKVFQARIYQVLKKHKDFVFGIDVSQYQGEIDWDEVRTVEGFPLSYALIRATAGADKLDVQFNNNWNTAKANQITRGAYHYYRPNENSIEQAKNFTKNVKLSKGDLPPILDIEKLPENQSMDSLQQGLKRWLRYVDDYYKVKPIIYTSEKYYKDFLKEEFKDYSFWIANYNFFVENIKDDWLFWQFTEKGQIEGIRGTVDVNIYNGTPKMFNYLLISN